MVLELRPAGERDERYELTGLLPPLAIPATLHDSLMARPDCLVTVKSLAQLGRRRPEFAAPRLYAVAPGRRDRAAGAAPAGRGRVPVPAGGAAAGDLRLQACADPGRCLSIPPAQHPPGAPSAYRAGVSASNFQRPSRPSPSCWRITTPPRGGGSSPSATGSGQGPTPSSAQPTPRRPSHLTRGRGIRRRAHLPETPGRAQQELDLHLTLGIALVANEGPRGPRGGAHLHAGVGVMRPGGRHAPALSDPVGPYNGSIATGGR